MPWCFKRREKLTLMERRDQEKQKTTKKRGGFKFFSRSSWNLEEELSEREQPEVCIAVNESRVDCGNTLYHIIDYKWLSFYTTGYVGIGRRQCNEKGCCWGPTDPAVSCIS